MPLYNFCKVQCNFYKQCRSEKNPTVPCIQPSGCTCEESQPMPIDEKSKVLIPPPPSDRCMEPCKDYWQCRTGGQGGGVHVEKPHFVCPMPDGCMCEEIKPMPIDEKSKVLIPPPSRDRCMEPCKEYWQCRIGGQGGGVHVEKPHLACPRPDGCMCEESQPRIARSSVPLDDAENDIDDLHMPLMPGRGQQALRRCRSQCALFHVCKRLIFNRGMNRPTCEEPVGCNCDQFP